MGLPPQAVSCVLLLMLLLLSLADRIVPGGTGTPKAVIGVTGTAVTAATATAEIGTAWEVTA